MKTSIEKKVGAGISIAVAFLIINALVSYRATRQLIESDRWVAHTREVLVKLEATISTVTNAESGQRGYLLTGEDKYLEPYNDALARVDTYLAQLESLTSDNPKQQPRLAVLKSQIATKRNELRQTIDLRKTGGLQAAIPIVLSDQGKKEMDAIRTTVAEMESDENQLLALRAQESKSNRRNVALTFLIATAFASGLLFLIAYFIIRDVREHKHVEDLLGQQREWMRVTLSSIGDAVIATDTAGSITFLNPVAESLTGWTQSDAAGTPLECVFNIVNEQTRKQVENPALRAIKEGVVVGLANHTVLISKSGTETPVDDSGAPIKDSQGKTIGAVLVFRAIAERRQQEKNLAQLATIVDYSDDVILSKDLDGRITSWNKTAERLFGYTAAEIKGKPVSMLMPPDRADDFPKIMEQLRRGEIVGHYETVRISKNGTRMDMSVTVSPMKDAEGSIIGASEIARDITERRRAEDERSQLLASERAARERAEAAARAKDEFVAIISHEVRAPLNAILGWAQMLRTRPFDTSETARALETIERNAKTQAQLIDDLLDISRIITGKIRLEVRPVEVSRIVESGLDAVRPAADAKSIQVRSDLQVDGAFVLGDPDRLLQIVWNLLSNAVKFTPKDGQVNVSVERVDSHVQIVVSDTGAGISKEFLPHVFDRFAQADSTSSRKYGGLGLGLAITRHLVELHGGTVTAESPGEGLGATFRVTLPARAAAAIEPQEDRYDARGVAATAPLTLTGVRIVVADDDEEMRALLSVMLTQQGAEVRACSTAAEAFETVKGWQPFAIVSDIGMPDEDGYSLIRQVRALDPDQGGKIAAVALTGFARREDRMRALGAGFNMYIPKPVEPAELVTVIASLLDRSNN